MADVGVEEELLGNGAAGGIASQVLSEVLRLYPVLHIAHLFFIQLSQDNQLETSQVE